MTPCNNNSNWRDKLPIIKATDIAAALEHFPNERLIGVGSVEVRNSR